MQNIFIVFVYSFSKLLVSDEKTTRSDALSSMLDIFRFVPENFSIVLDFQVKWLDDYFAIDTETRDLKSILKENPEIER